jgi:hypothetical protein
MTEIHTQAVTFHVRVETRDRIPAGDYGGYIEWTILRLGSGSKPELMRCMLHIGRTEYPSLFSPNNSMMSMDINVLADVKRGIVTYDEL